MHSDAGGMVLYVDKRQLFKSKENFVCTQISHILIVLVVLLIGNVAYFLFTFL